MAETRRLVIVGGVAGGASAATRARRLSEQVEIVLIERGREVSYANCGLPYHIGGVIADRDDLLVQTPEGLWSRYRIQVKVGHEAVRIDRAGRQVRVREVATGREHWEPYDALILSPGAEPIRPPIPGAEAPGVFTLRSLADMDRIKRHVDQQRPGQAVVVGGGYIGMEMTEALRARQVGVTLVVRGEHVFSRWLDKEMATPLHPHLQAHGVDLRLRTGATAIEAHDGTLRVRLSSGAPVEAGLVILATGVCPETTLAREAGLAIGPTGGIVVDGHMRTSDPHIFAVGDAVETTHLVGGHKVLIPLAGPANRQGRIAADNALGRPSVYTAGQGTAICKVFEMTVGLTGLSEKTLRQLGRRYEKVHVHPFQHADYYPGARRLSLKLLFDPAGGAILGAQAVGTEGVDKRIDVLAVALRAGLTVHDLAEQELAYAPPYGSAKDPINYAGFVASNVLSGDVALCHVEDVVRPRPDQVVLDVRTAEELRGGTIPGSVNIPIDELRQRLHELPRDKEILAFCQVGLRGYLACRILRHNGYRSRNLSGGYLTYKAAVEL